MRRDIGTTLPFLPMADDESVAEFIELYERKFAVRLTPEESYEILSGLMRFLYLTRFRDRGDSTDSSDPDTSRNEGNFVEAY